MQEWTYGVALQPLTADPTSLSVGLVAFGCPFFASGIPPPCVVGFWKDATKDDLTWKAPLDGASLSASSGPPSVHFSADGKQIIAVYTKPGTDPSVPPVEYVALVSAADGTVVATSSLLVPVLVTVRSATRSTCATASDDQRSCIASGLVIVQRFGPSE